MDILEKMFGKRPEKGYEFKEISVEQYPTGIDIAWLSSGVGFGHLTFGIRQGKWFADTECMSDDFVEALLIAAAPQLAKIIGKIEDDNRSQNNQG